MKWALAAALLACPALATGQGYGGFVKGGNVSPDGKSEVACYLPVDLRHYNTSGTNGLGLCVFWSCTFAARYQHETRLWDFARKMEGEPGAGWPSKVDRMILKYGPGTRYVNYVGSDPSIIRLAIKTGRMPCVTWNGNHMVNCVGYDDRWVSVLDNNAIKENDIRWLKEPDFLALWRKGGQPWVVVFLEPAPPPPPTYNPPAAGPQHAEQTWTVQHEEEEALGTLGVEPDLRDDPGLDRERLNETAPGYYLNGEQVTKERAFAEIAEKPRLLDDSGLPFLSIIGPGDVRQGIIEQLNTHPALAPLAQGFRIKSYSPDVWAVSRYGFKTDGNPTVYIQEPSGFPLHRTDGSLTADELAERMERALEIFALRKKDPNYDPTRDVDLGRLVYRHFIPGWVYWLAGLACFVVVAAPVATFATVALNRVRRPGVAPAPPKRPRKRPRRKPTAPK